MEDIIIIAGQDKAGVCWLRRCLRERGYNSLPCKSAEQVIGELEILPMCDARVPLVVIDPQILSEIENEVVSRLTECSQCVPMLALSKTNGHGNAAAVFDKICEHRTRFRSDRNPVLAEILENAGVEIM